MQEHSNKMEQCRFCFDWVSSIGEHKEQCKEKLGDVCQFCNQWYSRKFIETHEELCKPSVKKVEPKKHCPFCSKWISSTDFTEHETMCKQSIRSICKFCDMWVSEKYIEKHESLCKSRNKGITGPKKRCPFCFKWISSTDFTEHEKMCKQSLGSICKFCHTWFSKEYIEKHKSLCKSRNKGIKGPKTHCQFCSKWISSRIFQKHERACKGNRGAICVLCFQWFSKEYFQAHQSLCIHEQSSKNLRNRKAVAFDLPSTTELKIHVQSCEEFEKQMENTFKLASTNETSQLVGSHPSKRQKFSRDRRIEAVSNVHKESSATVSKLSKHKEDPFQEGSTNDTQSQTSRKYLTSTLQLCLKCKRYFREDIFPQHTCKLNVKSQIQSYSTSQRSATGTQSVVITPVILCDNNAQGEYSLETRTDMESSTKHRGMDEFQSGTIYELPTGIVHRLPNDVTPDRLPAGVIEITPVLEDPLSDFSDDITSQRPNQKEIEIASVISLKQEPIDSVHNVSEGDPIRADLNESAREQIEPIFTISGVRSIDTEINLPHQEPKESGVYVSSEVSGLTTDLSKQIDRVSYSFMASQTRENTDINNLNGFQCYRNSFSKKYRNRVVANLAKCGAKPRRLLKILHEARQCPLCCKTYSKRNLPKHLKKNCDKAFLIKCMCIEHNYTIAKHKIHHPEASLKDLLTDNTGNVESSRFVCSVCQKHCVSHRALVRHMRKVHIDESIYCCTFCSKSFTMQESLRQHEKIHAANRASSIQKLAYQKAPDLINGPTDTFNMNASFYSKVVNNCLPVLFPLLHKTLLKCPKCHLHFKCKRTLNEHLYNPCICSVCTLVLKCKTLTEEPTGKMVDNIKKPYPSQVKTLSKMTSGKQNSKHRRPYSRCLMCLHWYRAIEVHLWKCQVKRPCLNRVMEITTHIKDEPLDSTNYTNVLGSIVVQSAEQTGEMLFNSQNSTESELKSFIQEPGINMNYGLSSSYDRSSMHSSGWSIFCDDLEAEVHAEVEHQNVLECRRRKILKEHEAFITLKNKIPELQSHEHVPRIMILTKAAEYVKGLQIQEQQHIRELEEQRRINEHLLLRKHLLWMDIYGDSGFYGTISKHSSENSSDSEDIDIMT